MGLSYLLNRRLQKSAVQNMLKHERGNIFTIKCNISKKKFVPIRSSTPYDILVLRRYSFMSTMNGRKGYMILKLDLIKDS
jgi:hypothetical protein